MHLRTENRTRSIELHRADRIEIRATDATFDAWWISEPAASHPVAVLYCGGHAESVLYGASSAPKFDVRQMLAVNYRGYGRGAGKSRQQTLHDDALAIYDYAIDSGIRPEQIVVMGKSLGSGVAAILAACRPILGAVLITPFDCRAADYLPGCNGSRMGQGSQPRSPAPVLLLAAEHDIIIPPSHARRLYAAWNGTKQMHVFAGADHGSIEQHAEYFGAIEAFITGLSC